MIAGWEHDVCVIFNSGSGGTHLMSGVPRELLDAIASEVECSIESLHGIVKRSLSCDGIEQIDDYVQEIIEKLVQEQLVEPLSL